MGDKCIHCLVGTSEGKRLLGNICVYWQIILKLIWKTEGYGVVLEEAFWTGYIWHERGGGEKPGIHDIITIHW
jgi:hypothetical protein